MGVRRNPSKVNRLDSDVHTLLPGEVLVNVFLPRDTTGWDSEDFRQARLILMTCVFATTATLVLMALRFLMQIFPVGGVSIYLMCCVLNVLFVVLVRVGGDLFRISSLFVFASVAFFWLITLFDGGIFSPLVSGLFLVVMVSFLIGRYSILGWLTVGLCSLSIMSLWWMHFVGSFPPHPRGSNFVTICAMTIVSVFFFCGFVMDFVERQRRAFYHFAGDVLGDLVLAREEAEQANRSKSSFLASISHELRTPLSSIIGYSEILQEDIVDEEDESLDGLRRIHRSAEHLLDVINDLLDISKIEAGKLDLSIGTFELHTLLEEAILLSEPLAQKGGNTLLLVTDVTKKTMLADQLRVRQILLNLLSNACKFTENGTITLRLEEIEGMFLFHVHDTGCGISEEQQEKLFQPFRQAHENIVIQHGGTGLGLYICMQLCELMHGSITLQSEVGKGSTFTCSLPQQVELG